MLSNLLNTLRLEPDLSAGPVSHPTSRPRPTSYNATTLHSGENILRKLTLTTAAFALLFVGAVAHAQTLDAAFGFGGLTAPSATISHGLNFPSLRGGAYPVFSADFLLRHRIGLEGEIAWRASQNNYGNLPYRPIFWAFNGIWAPRLSKYFTAELVGGIGGEDLRFYGIPNFSQLGGYTTYTSSNHFMEDFGGGLRAYIWHDVFLRPEARLYLVHNNVEFSSGRSARYGISLGYSFGGK